MRGRLKRLIDGLNAERKGITGLETAIILIAFVVVASVFAYTVLSAGLFSSQAAKEAIETGMKHAGVTLQVRGSVIAIGNQTTNDVDYLVFTLGNALDGSEIDLRNPTPDPSNPNLPAANSTHVTTFGYHSATEVEHDLMYTATAKGWGDGDMVLETGEKFEVRLNLLGLTESLEPYDTITITCTPPTGATLLIQRTLPADIDQVINLH